MENIYFTVSGVNNVYFFCAYASEVYMILPIWKVILP